MILLRDETNNVAKNYFNQIVPEVAAIMLGVADFLDGYGQQDFNTWQRDLPETLRKLEIIQDHYKSVQERLTESIIELQKKSEKASKTQVEFENSIDQLGRSAKKYTIITFGIGLGGGAISFGLGIVFPPLAPVSVLGTTCLASATGGKAFACGEKKEIFGGSKEVLVHSLIPALKDFAANLEKTRIFIDHCSGKIAQMCQEGRAGRSNLHYKIMQAYASSTRNLCLQYGEHIQNLNVQVARYANSKHEIPRKLPANQLTQLRRYDFS